MEALALYDFTASGEDELSFRKGDILKILGAEDDWYKAELRSIEGYVPQNYVEMHVPKWYCENMSRVEAENVLIRKPLGSFIIRASQTSKGEFSISVRHEEDVQHFKVMRDKLGNYSLWAERFKSINKLVDYYKTTSVSRQKQIFLQDEGSVQPQMPPVGASNFQSKSAAEMPPIGASNFQSKSAAEVPTSSKPAKPAKPTPLVKALYDFKALEPDELDFYESDIIEVLDSPNAFWWLGKLGDSIGLFPTNYVTSINK